MSLRARPDIDVRVRRRLQRAVVHQRLTGSVTRDPKTGRVRRGRIEIAWPRLVLGLPKRLERPNAWLWAHWRTKKAAKDAWARLIATTVCDFVGRPSIADYRRPADAIGWVPPAGRLRVEIVRHVTRGPGIPDDDNLLFSAKGLADCLVQAGFLRDDTRKEIDLQVVQVPSADGLDLTVITIAPIPAAPGVPHADR
jgi:hypothetical protein